MAGVQIDGVNNKIDFDDDQDTSISANTDDTLVFEIAGATDFTMTANTFTAASGSTIAAQALTATTVTASGIVKTDDATEATSTTDGSLQTDGGLSVVKDAVFGDDIKLLSDAAVIHFGADSEITLTHDHNTGLILNTEGTANSLAIVSGDDATASGPSLNLKRDSASPADNDGLGAVIWTGRNDNSQDFQAAIIKAQASDVSDGTEDSFLYFRTMHAGSETEHMAFLTTETVFNDPSNDIDFRVESNGNANMLHVNGGSNLVGIGADPDLGTGLHIKTADSGASAHATGDELVIEGSGNAGLSILSGNTSEGVVYFGDTNDNNVGRFVYDHNLNHIAFHTSGSEQMRLNSSGILSLNEAAPDGTDGSICLNQAGGDAAIFTLKSSDVSHPYTSLAEADTYATFGKNSGGNGGLFIQGLSDSSTSAIQLRACGTDGDQTKSGAATGYIMLEATKTNGSTSVGSPGSNENLVTIRSATDDCVFIFDEEGDFHADNSSTTFDAFDDAQLVRAYDLSHGKGVINSKFDKFIAYNHEKLAELKLVGREKDGTPNSHVNITGMQRLHNGAIWQQYEKHQKLASAFYKLAEKTIGKEEADKLLTEEEIQLLN